jgi:DNA repair protein RadA/Sms
MPRPDEISGKSQEYLPVPSLPWLNEAVGEGFVRGGVYLLAGEPGIGKTALALQILADIALRGTKVLYVTTEQGLPDIKRALERVQASSGGHLPKALVENFYMDDSVDDIDALPKFLARRVLTDGQEYHGAQLMVVDSVQGRGLSAAAIQKYRALYEFAENAKAQGLVTLLIGHVTKKGQIAGPKDLEHNVDCVLYVRRAFRLRPLFVPKNRFGPAIIDPIVLVMDSYGRLTKSPLSAAKSAAVHGYAGMGDDLAEGQASVSLPKYGSRPELNAPFLPSKKIKQILTVLSTLKDVDLADLSYEINCYVPRQQRYVEALDLPLAVALLSSYLQQPVDPRTLFVGELDLGRKIRPPERTYLAGLAQLLLGPQKGKIKRVYISEDSVAALCRMQPDKNGPRVCDIVEVKGAENLELLLRELWPSLFAEGSIEE